VERELAIEKESVSETVRWISYGPRAIVVKYDAYNINKYTFHTKCHDGKVYQNSGVSVEEIDLHISKELATTRQTYYYGVLQEIWVLDYRFRQIPLFKCDWVNHKSGGVKRDKLGYTLVDLNNLGHKVDPFVLASQALQVFYVKDLVDKKLSIVFKTPPKNYKDTYDEVDEEFSTFIHHRNDNDIRIENIVVNLDSSSDNNNSDSYSTSQISTSEEIDYDSPEPPKSLLKWYHYLSDEYKDNGRFWGSKSGCNESDVKPSWKDIEKAKACMLAKAQASEASSKAKVEACGSKAKLQASTKTLIVKSPGRGSLEVDSDVNLLYDVMFFEIIDISSDSSDDRRWAAKKASAPVFYGPSTQGLLDAYGYNTIEEYLSWNYFPSTDNESIDMETTDKRNTDKDCIVDSNSTMSKAVPYRLVYDASLFVTASCDGAVEAVVVCGGIFVRGMWDRRVSIGHIFNENSGLSTLEPLMELIIEHCTGKCNHSIGNEMVSFIIMEDDVDINTLTIEQYLAWVQDDIRVGVVKPKIGNDVEFEINSNFMRELRRKLFKGTIDEDAHEHVRKVLEIVDLFHFPDVTHDAVMLRVFPITLKGKAKQWIK
ncbi:hypothetical protein Tco_0528544, partial [Tanacetum coccineum]